MATQRIKDLAVRTGTYTDSNGEQKGRYENIGSLFKKDDGNLFMTIKATFNPAGIEREPGKDSIIISLFDPKDKQQAAPPQRPQRQAAPQRQPQGQPHGFNVGDDDLSDLPF